MDDYDEDELNREAEEAELMYDDPGNPVMDIYDEEELEKEANM